METKREKKVEYREIAPGVILRRKDSQKFLEDLINAGNPIWIWIERISHLIVPVLVLFLLVKLGGF